MQSASDIFLGWTQDSSGRHFYVRQLRDVKLKFRIEQLKSAKMLIFAEWCGGTLARATPVRVNRHRSAATSARPIRLIERSAISR